MTGEEIKAAFLDQCPVICGDITYQRISALIYRRNEDRKGFLLQVELLDKNSNSVTIATAEKVRRDKL